MENHAAAHSTIVLRVKIHDCDQCPQKLRKLLLRFDGVYGVDVEPKKEMVTVSGRVEAAAVIKYLESKNMKAKFISSDDKNYNHSEDSSSEDVKKKGAYKNRHNRRDEKKDNVNGNSGHVMEAYEAPTIDPLYCRDPYCKLHKSKPTIQSKVPSIHSDDHPKHTHGYSFPLPAGGSHQSFLFGGGYPMVREPPHMMRPPASFFGPGTSFMPEGFGYYGDAAPNFRGRRGPFL